MTVYSLGPSFAGEDVVVTNATLSYIVFEGIVDSNGNVEINGYGAQDDLMFFTDTLRFIVYDEGTTTPATVRTNIRDVSTGRSVLRGTPDGSGILEKSIDPRAYSGGYSAAELEPSTIESGVLIETWSADLR